jgi:2-haloacid dehalogenase
LLARLGIRDVVFDLGGVLLDWDPRYLFRDHLGHDHAAVEDFLTCVCTPDWHRQLDAGVPFARAADDLMGQFPARRDWIEAYARGWPRMFAGVFPGAVDFLLELAARGYRVHALSNYPGEQIAFLYRTFPFMSEFDTVVLSGLLGTTKPDPRIFVYLHERIAFRPCLYIDDRVENVAAARSCGIESIHFSGRDGCGPLRELLET